MFGARSKVCEVVAVLGCFGLVSGFFGSFVQAEKAKEISGSRRADVLGAFVHVGPAGLSLRRFLEEVARGVSLELLIDPDVGPEVLEKRMGLELRYSRARDALAWAAEVGGVRVHLVGGRLLVRKGGKTPVALALLGMGGIGEGEAEGSVRAGRRQADFLERVARVDLVDASLLGAARALAEAYHVDLVVTEGVLNRQALVTVGGDRTTLGTAVGEVCRQSGASWAWRHGAIVITDGGTTGQTANSVGPVEVGLEGRAPRVRQGGGSGEGSGGERCRAGRLRVDVGEIAVGRLLTRLREECVNGRVCRPVAPERMVSLRASGTVCELIDLVEALPARPVEAR